MKSINKKVRRLWGVSEVGFSIMSIMETTFLLYFLTDIAKYPLGVSAAITGFSAAADALCAIFAGAVIDRVSFKNGKYRPWLLYCPPLVTASFVFCFTRIGSDLLAGGIVITAYVLSHFFWTIAWTANRNLISVLTDDPGEISFLSARIAIGGSLGKISGSFLVPQLAAAMENVLSGVAAYTVVAVITCCLFMAGYFVHFLITKGADSAPAAEKRTVLLGELLRSLAGNSNLAAVLLHDAIRLISFYGIAASTTYYARVVLLDSSAVTEILLMFYAGTTVGACFSRRLSNRYGVRGATAISCAGCAVLHGLCYFSNHFFLTMVLLFFAQMSFGMAFGLTSKLYSMCGVYGEWKTGKNAQGMIMSLGSLAVKLAVAVRGLLIAGVLGMIQYVPDAAMVPLAAQGHIKLLFFVVFSGIMLLSLIPLAFFRLTDASVLMMASDISTRGEARLCGAGREGNL